MKRLNEGFKNVFTYAAGMENWVNSRLFYGPLKYTFVNDFAVADWCSGINGVKETYNRVKKEWLKDHKAWTAVVISVNNLAFAHKQRKIQGFAEREPFIELYSDLYEQAKQEFFAIHGDDQEKIEFQLEEPSRAAVIVPSIQPDNMDITMLLMPLLISQ